MSKTFYLDQFADIDIDAMIHWIQQQVTDE